MVAGGIALRPVALLKHPTQCMAWTFPWSPKSGVRTHRATSGCETLCCFYIAITFCTAQTAFNDIARSTDFAGGRRNSSTNRALPATVSGRGTGCAGPPPPWRTSSCPAGTWNAQVSPKPWSAAYRTSIEQGLPLKACKNLPLVVAGSIALGAIALLQQQAFRQKKWHSCPSLHSHRSIVLSAHMLCIAARESRDAQPNPPLVFGPLH